MIDVLFLIAGIALVIWGVIGVANPDLSWRINGRTGIRPVSNEDRPGLDWPALSRRYGVYGIVIGLLNVFFSALKLF